MAANVATTPDGGFIICGTTNSSDGDVTNYRGNHDLWLVKTDSTGNLIWQKTLGGSDDDTECGMRPTPDGGYLIWASTGSHDYDCQANPHPSAWWFLKVDTAGQIAWSRFMPSDYSWVHDAMQTNEGEILICGGNDAPLLMQGGDAEYWLLIAINIIGGLKSYLRRCHHIDLVRLGFISYPALSTSAAFPHSKREILLGIDSIDPELFCNSCATPIQKKRPNRLNFS